MRRKRNRYRTDKTKPLKTLKRWGKVTLGITLVPVAVLLLSAALAHSYHALLEAPWLRVEEMEISGMKRTTRQEALNAMGVPKDTNAMTLKMEQLARRLEALPWVKSAVVRLDLPGRIVVEATEREPLAIISAEDPFVLDTEGILFLRGASAEQMRDVPFVTGFAGMDFTDGSVFPAELFDAVRRVSGALANAHGWLPLHQVSECRWQSDEGFVLLISQRNVPVKLGLEDLDQKMERLKRIYGMLADRQWQDLATRIDLDYPNRAYVEGSFPPPKTVN